MPPERIIKTCTRNTSPSIYSCFDCKFSQIECPLIKSKLKTIKSHLPNSFKEASAYVTGQFDRFTGELETDDLLIKNIIWQLVKYENTEHESADKTTQEHRGFAKGCHWVGSAGSDDDQHRDTRRQFFRFYKH